MPWKKLLWIFALPVYVLINSLRHESGHAFAAGLEGAHVENFSFWPYLTASGELGQGAASWSGQTTWLTVAMPYLFDLVTVLVFFYICMAYYFRRRWVWWNLVIIGMVSPLLNSAYQYFLIRMDLRVLLTLLSPTMVDIFFVAAMFFYVTAIGVVLLFSRTQMPSPADQLAGQPV